MFARIYQPARNAMQSGQGNSERWVLEYAPQSARTLDPLMGWTGTQDMHSQIKMRFDTLEAAVDFAKGKGLAYQVQKPNKRQAKLRLGGYGENFASNRKTVWTH